MLARRRSAHAQGGRSRYSRTATSGGPTMVKPGGPRRRRKSRERYKRAYRGTVALSARPTTDPVGPLIPHLEPPAPSGSFRNPQGRVPLISTSRPLRTASSDGAPEGRSRKPTLPGYEKTARTQSTRRRLAANHRRPPKVRPLRGKVGCRHCFTNIPRFLTADTEVRCLH